MFHSPRLSRSPMNFITNKRFITEQCQTIEQLKHLVEELNLQHQKKEGEYIRQIGLLYHDLQQNRKKMAHLILKYQQQQQQQKKSYSKSKTSSQDSSTQTDPMVCLHCSLKNSTVITPHDGQHSVYYEPGRDDQHQYICATPQPSADQPSSSSSLSSPTLSTTDPSSIKHHESSSSAYNTAESLPSSHYSDRMNSLERVLNAASTMYTTQANLEHTIQLQEELFRQRLRLRGIQLHDDHDEILEDDQSSEHLYDNIDSEISDLEDKQNSHSQRQLCRSAKKKSTTYQQPQLSSRKVTFQQHASEPIKRKMTPQKVRFSDQYYSLSKRKSIPSSCKHHFLKSKKTISSKLLTVTIT